MLYLVIQQTKSVAGEEGESVKDLNYNSIITELVLATVSFYYTYFYYITSSHILLSIIYFY